MVKFTPLEVSSSFVIVNGLLGVNRNVVLRLLFIMMDQNIRAVVGMCHEFFIWKKHVYFIENRNKFIIPNSFRTNLYGDCEFTHKRVGIHCRFPFDNRTVFLDTQITEGIFNWTVKIEYAREGSSGLYPGIALTSLLGYCDGRFLGTMNGTCCLRIDKWFPHEYKTVLRGVDGDRDLSDTETMVPDRSLVTVEADLTAGTLVFFVNGHKVPCGVSRLVGPLHFGISGLGNPSFTSLLLRRQLRPTRSPVVCRLYTFRSRR